MPNWNKTKYVFTGSKEEIGKFNEIINKSLSDENLKSGDFGNDWLGFLVKELNEDSDKIFCRGWIEKPKLINKTTLKFTTWTAWASCYELFELVCKKFPTLEYYFISENTAYNKFVTNDIDKKYFKDEKKYKYWSKDDIKKVIQFEKEINQIIDKRIIPNDSIYLRIPNLLEK